MTPPPPRPPPGPPSAPRSEHPARVQPAGGRPRHGLSIDGIVTRLARERAAQRDLLARHRRSVTIARRVLPVLAVLLLAALAVFPDLRSGAGIGRVSYHTHGTAADAAQSRMTAARYHGVDGRGEPFTLTASRASQLSHDRIALSDPKGDITLKSGAWVMLSAKRGLYRQNDQVLAMHDHVRLYRDDGTTMLTRRADIDLKSGSAEGRTPVTAYGPFGTLHAKDGFAVADRGGLVVFKGRSHLLLDHAPIGGASGDGAAQASPQ